MKASNPAAIRKYQALLEGDIPGAEIGPVHIQPADLKKNTIDKTSAQNIAEYLVAIMKK